MRASENAGCRRASANFMASIKATKLQATVEGQGHQTFMLLTPAPPHKIITTASLSGQQQQQHSSSSSSRAAATASFQQTPRDNNSIKIIIENINMASPNHHTNALKVLAETASDDELLNRHGDAKNGSRSSSGNMDPSSDDSTSSGAKGDDESGDRGSCGNNSGGKASADKKGKKDVGLRKGKWMVSRKYVCTFQRHFFCRDVFSYLIVSFLCHAHSQEEEEEYTTRVIHHFSTGLISLPEGKTLRSFLAEKLQCDPMRITKKYAGASCLSKRIHSMCERPQFTPQELEEARSEIERLEERFLLRLKYGPGAVLPPTKTPVSVRSVSSSLPPPQSLNSYAPVAPGYSVSAPGATINPPGQIANAQQALALLVQNAQLAAASNPAAAASTFVAAPPSNESIQQAAPAAPPAPAMAPALMIPQVLQMPAPTPAAAAAAAAFNLQALLSQNNQAQPNQAQQPAK